MKYIFAILFIMLIILHVLFIGIIDSHNFIVSVCFGGILFLINIVFIYIVKKSLDLIFQPFISVILALNNQGFLFPNKTKSASVITRSTYKTLMSYKTITNNNSY